MNFESLDTRNRIPKPAFSGLRIAQMQLCCSGSNLRRKVKIGEVLGMNVYDRKRFSVKKCTGFLLTQGSSILPEINQSWVLDSSR
jgi:hypothetical protein